MNVDFFDDQGEPEAKCCCENSVLHLPPIPDEADNDYEFGFDCVVSGIYDKLIIEDSFPIFKWQVEAVLKEVSDLFFDHMDEDFLLYGDEDPLKTLYNKGVDQFLERHGIAV